MKLRKTLMLAATVALLALLGTVQANAQGARQRPFSDWLNAQGNPIKPNICYYSILGWSTPDFSTFALADYSGKMGACVTANGGPTFHPVFRGTVTERDLPDGTAEILVNEQFTNTYAYALDTTQFPLRTLLGSAQYQYLGQPTPTAVASGMLQVKFIIPFPGAPLPDLEDAVFSGAVESISARINGDGPLRAEFGVPEGTPGKFVVSQTGLFNIPGRGNGVADGFPAEIVRVFKAGN
jgi:hypothetical protein